ncbi:hypothetical protein HRG_008163 [Hirsutella rhossiliensis]|uniref:Uncharacterized protein n=1 Tax=Hirsutella rhossiliensis TaxID=111463 RepID=A0A9P8SGZ6_9HYPO|nr:uncharacterized protein HRG_08163 [Hirsutella rhossiliensis]KAH0961010.1 hypothetical protein HRG_08163 [Hirsutella rhossiliensis]
MSTTPPLVNGSEAGPDGASEVQDGASEVQDGASEVQDGASEVQDGASEVQSLAELRQLAPAERKVFFRRFLVHNDIIVVDHADVDVYLSPRLSAAQNLRKQSYVGGDEVGAELVKAANEVYYGENEFKVQLHCLGDFIRNAGGDEDPPAPIAPLVQKKFTIEMELHDIWHSAEVGGVFHGPDNDNIDYNDEENGDLARWTRGKLRYAFLLTNVESIHVMLLGAGLIDGSDLATHQTIKEISSMVRKLIVQFGSRFDISKRLTRGHNLERSIKSYWDAPSDEARMSVRNGHATTEEMMRVEIARWLDEDKREPGPDGEWDRLV